MSQTFALVNGGVVEIIETIPNGIVPGVDIFTPEFAANLVSVRPDLVGLVAQGWTYSAGEFSAPVVAGPTLPELQTALITAAASACDFLTSQVNRTQTHAAAFFNVASVVSANGGTVPTTGPLASSLAALATIYGGSTTAFGELSGALQKAAMDNLTTLVTLETAALSATTSHDLATALTAFETSLTAVFDEIAAAGATIAAPTAISIVGINA